MHGCAVAMTTSYASFLLSSGAEGGGKGGQVATFCCGMRKSVHRMLTRSVSVLTEMLPWQASGLPPRKRSAEQQAHGKLLVTRLDEILLSQFRCARAQKNGAGRRALGAGGRSLHDVLRDAIRCVREILYAEEGAVRRDGIPAPSTAHGRQQGTAQTETPTVDVDRIMREALLSAHSLVCIEVVVTSPNSNEYTILQLGQGAHALLSQAPWGDCTGSNVLYFMHHDDADKFTHFLQSKARQELFADMVQHETSSAASTVRSPTPDVVSVRMKRFFQHRLCNSNGKAVHHCMNPETETQGSGEDAAERKSWGADWGTGVKESKGGKGGKASGKDSAPSSLAFPQLLADDPLLEAVDISPHDPLLDSMRAAASEPGGAHDNTVAGGFRKFSCCEYVDVDVTICFPTRSRGVASPDQAFRDRALLLIDVQSNRRGSQPSPVSESNAGGPSGKRPRVDPVGTRPLKLEPNSRLEPKAKSEAAATDQSKCDSDGEDFHCVGWASSESGLPSTLSSSLPASSNFSSRTEVRAR